MGTDYSKELQTVMITVEKTISAVSFSPHLWFPFTKKLSEMIEEVKAKIAAEKASMKR